MSVKLTTSYWKIKALDKKIRIVQGSQGASKTYSILIYFFEIAYTTPNTILTVVTESYPLLKDGVIADMKNIVFDSGMNFEKMYNISDKDLKFHNGSVIQFRNLDNKDFHKGKGSRREYLFINEGNRLSWTSLEQMVTRTAIATFIDFNPDREFFVHEEFINTTRDDVDFIVLTYKDNECLPDGEREEIERRVEASKKPGASNQLKNWVRVYAYGELGTYSDRQIYNYEFIKKIPDNAKRISSGMDFGVSPDPTTLIDLWINGSNLYCDEVFCMNNLLPQKLDGAKRMSIVDKLDEVHHMKGHMIVADSAGKTEILDIRKHGYNIKGVKKPQGSISPSINKVRGYNIFITERSVNLKKGIESWFWKVDHNGKIIPEPDGHEPDGLAAIRYVILTNKKKRGIKSKN